MTPQRDAERILEEWMVDGPSQLADHVIDRIVRDLDQTQQRKSRWLPGRTFMNRAILAIGAAAAGVVLLAGALYLTAGDSGTGLAPPMPTSPAPTATSTSSPLPTLAPRLSSGELRPGTYRVLAEAAVPVELTVPAGWSGIEGWALVKGSDAEFVAGLSFWSPDQATRIYGDPCDWESNYMDRDGSVDATPTGVTDALAAQPLRGDAEPQDVTVDGYGGKLIELTLPGDLDFSTCDGEEPYSWIGRAHQGPGQVDRVYVIDVDGALLVFDASYMPDAPAEVVQELEAIVDSLRVQP